MTTMFRDPIEAVDSALDYVKGRRSLSMSEARYLATILRGAAVGEAADLIADFECWAWVSTQTTTPAEPVVDDLLDIRLALVASLATN